MKTVGQTSSENTTNEIFMNAAPVAGPHFQTVLCPVKFGKWLRAQHLINCNSTALTKDTGLGYGRGKHERQEERMRGREEKGELEQGYNCVVLCSLLGFVKYLVTTNLFFFSRKYVLA